MVRKSYSAMILAAAAALVMVGCGKEDLTDLQDTWAKKDGDVTTKLMELKNKNQQLHTEFNAVQAANITDSTKMADRTAAETMLNDHDKQIGEIETMLADLRTKRDSAAAAGKRAEYETAWKAAETEYEAALAKISTLESQSSEIDNKLDGLTSASATPKDTAAVNATGDSATAKSDMKKDEKVTAEGEKKADEKKDAEKTAEGETKTEEKKDAAK